MERYIEKVFKSMGKKNKKLSGELKFWINEILFSVFHRFVHGGVTMLESRQQNTLNDDDIRAVASMVLIGNLAIRGVEYIDKMCVVYSTEKTRKKPLFFPPARVEFMLRDGLYTYKKNIRMRPLAPVALASILEFLTRSILETCCDDSDHSILSKEDVLRTLPVNKPLQNTLCSSGLLS